MRKDGVVAVQTEIPVFNFEHLDGCCCRVAIGSRIISSQLFTLRGGLVCALRDASVLQLLLEHLDPTVQRVHVGL